MKIYHVLILMFLSLTATYAQTPSFVWARQISSFSLSSVSSIDKTPSGDVVLLGGFTGTVDLDPGPASFTKAANPSNYNAFAVKLDAQGNFIWGKTFEARIGQLDVDLAGNIVITGYFQLTADFDPGPGVFNMSPNGIFEDVFVLKLDPSGNFLWAININTSNIDYGMDVATDASNNVYVTGSLNYNPFITKISAGGSIVWTKTVVMSLSGGGLSEAIVLDGSGNVYITGRFNNQGDFDPGAGTFTMNSTVYQNNPGTDVFVLKLDAFGNFVWAKQFAGALAEEGTGIVVDNSGNVYTGGLFNSPVDFDPGPGTNILTPGAADSYITKLDAAGNFIWARQLGNSSNSGCVLTVRYRIDGNSDLYIAGWFYGGAVDLDPGAGTSIFSPAGPTVPYPDLDAFVAKINPSGNLLWVNLISGVAAQGAYGMAIDPAGYLYSVGTHSGTTDFDPGTTSSTLSSFNNKQNGFVQKIQFCVASTLTASANNSLICLGNSATLTASGAGTYTWSGGANSASLSVSPTTNTVYSVSGTTTNQCVSSQTIGISVSPLPIVSTSSTKTLICMGETSTITTGGGVGYTLTGSQAPLVLNSSPPVLGPPNFVVSPLVTTSYVANGSNSAGCSGNSAITISVVACVGFEEALIDPDENMYLFPNPNNGSFSISVSGKMKISISDELGQVLKMFSHDGNVPQTLQFVGLEKGVYVLQGFSGSQVFTKKIIVN